MENFSAWTPDGSVMYHFPSGSVLQNSLSQFSIFPVIKDLLQRFFSSVPLSKWDYSAVSQESWPLITRRAQPWEEQFQQHLPFQNVQKHWRRNHSCHSCHWALSSCRALTWLWVWLWAQLWAHPPDTVWDCLGAAQNFTPLTPLPTEALVTASPNTLPKSARGKKIHTTVGKFRWHHFPLKLLFPTAGTPWKTMKWWQLLGPKPHWFFSVLPHLFLYTSPCPEWLWHRNSCFSFFCCTRCQQITIHASLLPFHNWKSQPYIRLGACKPHQ